MLKLKGKKIFTILRSKNVVYLNLCIYIYISSDFILPILQQNTGCFPIQKRPVFLNFGDFFSYLRILLGFTPKFKRHRLHPHKGNKTADQVLIQAGDLGFSPPPPPPPLKQEDIFTKTKK